MASPGHGALAGALAIHLASVGCFSVVDGDDTTPISCVADADCPSGTTCDATTDVCACADFRFSVQSGCTECAFGFEGEGCSVRAHCGDGVVDRRAHELCDDGNDRRGDGCSDCLPDPLNACDDGEDNDDDGLVDFPDDPGCDNPGDATEYNTPFCATGTIALCGTDVGVCEVGTRSCINNRWGPCKDFTGPDDELCDGLDNDCDRRTDEDIAERCLFNGCAGQRTCIENPTIVGGLWSECAPTSSSAEVCDGLDNDCNGKIDDGIAEVCMIDDCPGSRECVPGATGIYTPCRKDVPRAEVCNGVDDDCDGATDEDIPDLTCGVGVCARTVSACVNGTPQSCLAGTGSSEICNSMDDDCDTMVDEDIADLICGLGVCTRSAPGCVRGSVGICTPGTGSSELCSNGLDEDCDGMVDEPGCECGLTSVGADPQEPNNAFATPNPVETPSGVGRFVYEYDVTLPLGDQDWIAFNFPGTGIGTFAEMVVEVTCVGWATTGCVAGPTVGLDAWYGDDLQPPQLDDSDDGTRALARVRSAGSVDLLGMFGRQRFQVNVYPSTIVCSRDALQAHLRVTLVIGF